MEFAEEAFRVGAVGPWGADAEGAGQAGLDEGFVKALAIGVDDDGVVAVLLRLAASLGFPGMDGEGLEEEFPGELLTYGE